MRRRQGGSPVTSSALSLPPYKVHTVLTDNGTHFTDPTSDDWTPEDIKVMRAQKMLFRCHASRPPAPISTSNIA